MIFHFHDRKSLICNLESNFGIRRFMLLSIDLLLNFTDFSGT